MFHFACKKVPYVSLSDSGSIKPTKPNGIKLELSVLDIFPHTECQAAGAFFNGRNSSTRVTSSTAKLG